MLRWLLPVFVSSAQGALLRNVAIGVLDSNGTAASPGEVPASLSVGFTTVSDNTNLATVTLPSGLASSGTLSFGARRLEEADESDFDVGRRLAATCEAYGTASISGTTLTFSVRQINTGSTPCAAGSSLSVTLTAGTASYSSLATGQLDFAVQTNADSDPVSVAITVDNSGTFSLSVVGDPITFFKGKKIKFWFPPHELLPLLITPEMTIWASTFQGPSMDYQWFDRFLVTSESQEIADIRVGRVPEGANRSHFGRWDFRQLDIRIRGTRLRRRAQQLFSSPDGQVKVAVGARVVDAPRVRSSPLMEFVMVESASISFMVHASHAGSEFPGDPEKQVKYTHLDFVNLETAGMEHFQGILPQLWGIKVRSPEVEQMLVPPSQRKDLERVVCDSA